ncbi:Holliday junction branch migration DNA helicase RuvB [Rhodospirillaceae bacterium SYSU D60014]|uniref:Holliday junction branch migration DNA helicase RuvB n=1 Tax=Virgifigura deserti TaxID=2268457 RepID=UPI000E66B370
MSDARIIAAESAADDAPEAALRPLSLAEFTGQQQLRDNLAVFIEAARARGEALDHVLFFGPPGLGKTTLAQIVARELGVGFRATSGPVIARAGDLAALLTNLQPRDVLFIDEIHRLNPAVEEILYPAMEDFQLDLIIGEGPAARSVRIDLPQFTLVGATTRSGLITTPLRERFGIPLRLQFYTPEELEQIIRRGARLLGMDLSASGAAEIARRARGTPRVAGRLLRRVRDFAAVAGATTVDAVAADAALMRLDVDAQGLDAMDRRYLRCIADHHGGGPVGVETLSAALSEQRDVLEEVIEPYLIQQGLLQRSPRGRLLTGNGFRYLGLTPPKTVIAQLDMLEEVTDE